MIHIMNMINSNFAEDEDQVKEEIKLMAEQAKNTNKAL